jgi:predicted metalloprotease with PDZ domain
MRVSALARLEPPLTHELFHLWIPNALRLTGDYDWFYEGFTNYQALRAAQRLGFINFDGELDALARAYDACESAKDRGAASLVEASARRWSGANALIYNKGTLVAALYDLRLRKLTGGKRSLDDLYRALFRDAHAPATGGRDANAFVIAKLNEIAGDREIVTQFVEGTGEIDLGAELSPYGLRVERVGARTHIFVASNLSGSQRDLLREIGYNN